MYAGNRCVGDKMKALGSYCRETLAALANPNQVRQDARLAGAVRRFDARSMELPFSTFPSTHSFGPAEIVALAKQMQRMPRTMRVIGVELSHTDFGAAMSPPVQAAVEALVCELDRE